MTTGIYKIINTTNGKFYIGSSVKIEQRWVEHKSDLRLERHHSRHLQRAYDKYGADAFEFKIVEEVENPKRLLIREQHYLDTLTPYQRDVGYNSVKNAHNCLGFKHTEESKKKMSESRKGTKRTEETKRKMSESAKKWRAENPTSDETRQRMRESSKIRWSRPDAYSEATRRKQSEAHKGREAWNKGTPCSEETKKKISEANKGREGHWKGKKHSEETKRKMGESRSGENNWRSIMDWEMVSVIRRRYLEGETQRGLAKEFGVSRGCIQGIVRNNTWYDENYDKAERR
jgi:group I intron endonuclease